MISAQIHHKQESYERVQKCAKVKGHAELKIENPRVKTLVTLSPNYTIPTLAVSAVTSTYANFKKSGLGHSKIT